MTSIHDKTYHKYIRNMKKIWILLFCLGSLTVQAKDYYLTPAESGKLKEILNNGTLQPGDEVVLRDGVYDSLEELDFFAHGTSTDSITLRAEHAGKAVISGALKMRVCGEYLQIEGLFFHKAWAKDFSMIEFKEKNGVYASHCRLTNCVIDDCNDPKKSEKSVKGVLPMTVSEYWVSLYGTNNRVDHCYFANKRVGGLVLQLWLNEDVHLNNHLVDHNVFGTRQPYGGNGAEIIRIGHSWSSQLESHAIVENNIFLHCDGENEIISVKSGHNILRHNLFFESRGGLVCRHGHDNVIESNTFVGNDIPGTCGIRLINQGHTVYDNLVCRTAGFGLLVRMGVYERPDANTDIKKEPLTSYHRAENIDVAHNAFVDCKIIDLGSGRGDKEPRNVRLAYNYFGNKANNIRISSPEKTLPGFNFMDNRYFWADRSTYGQSGFVSLPQAEDYSAKERTRVLESLKETGAAWYSGNAKDIRYISSKYQ